MIQEIISKLNSTGWLGVISICLTFAVIIASFVKYIIKRRRNKESIKMKDGVSSKIEAVNEILAGEINSDNLIDKQRDFSNKLRSFYEKVKPMEKYCEKNDFRHIEKTRQTLMGSSMKPETLKKIIDKTYNTMLNIKTQIEEHFKNK